MPGVHPPWDSAEASPADGTTVEPRPLGPEDHRAVLDLHAAGMSEESRRMRFFGVSRSARYSRRGGLRAAGRAAGNGRRAACP